jgi:predicted DsbA family dithiol-disulfide isomerase
MAATDAELTVYSDYVCPFCYLGRRSLEQYEAERGEPMDLDWHPFDLRAHKRGPDGEIDHGVDDGKDEDYYERAKQNVRRLQERYGVEMDLDIATDIDSLPAQLVSYHVKETAPEDWRDFDEAVFEALWVDGRDIGDPAVLRELAGKVGLDPDVVDEALTDDGLRDRLYEQFEAAHRHGVTGVPTFAYDGYAARGAVPPDQLRRLVEGT